MLRRTKCGGRQIRVRCAEIALAHFSSHRSFHILWCGPSILWVLSDRDELDLDFALPVLPPKPGECSVADIWPLSSGFYHRSLLRRRGHDQDDHAGAAGA